MKTIKSFFISSLSAILLVGCAVDPYKQGRSLAEEYDECVTQFTAALAKVDDAFVEGSEHYATRTEATNAYHKSQKECYRTYSNKWSSLETKAHKAVSRYEAKDLSQFISGLSTRSYDRFPTQAEIENAELSVPVRRRISQIIPPIPTEDDIMRDLVGHQLTEGYSEGYHEINWKWEIQEGQISDFLIVEEQENSEAHYRILVTMTLTSATCAYKAKVAISYILDDIHDWRIEYVQSKGMDIVRTHRYDDCVKCYYTKGISGSLVAFNSSDVALEVGWRELGYDNKWHKFSRIARPHEQTHLSWTQIDFIVDYVERP